MMHTFTVYVEDRPGVLNRVSSLFRRRSFNIISLAVGHSETPGVSRMTVVVQTDAGRGAADRGAPLQADSRHPRRGHHRSPGGHPRPRADQGQRGPRAPAGDHAAGRGLRRARRRRGAGVDRASRWRDRKPRSMGCSTCCVPTACSRWFAPAASRCRAARARGATGAGGPAAAMPEAERRVVLGLGSGSVRVPTSRSSTDPKLPSSRLEKPTRFALRRFFVPKIYYDADADLALIRGRKVAILGYGSQGHAHALNLRDSGVDVRVGLHAASKSRAKAEADGLDGQRSGGGRRVGGRDHGARAGHGPGGALSRRDPAQPEAGKTLMFAHGFNVRFGTLDLPKDIDVSMIAPKSPGPPRPRAVSGRRRHAGAARGAPGCQRPGAARSRSPTARASASPAPG